MFNRPKFYGEEINEREKSLAENPSRNEEINFEDFNKKMLELKSQCKRVGILKIPSRILVGLFHLIFTFQHLVHSTLLSMTLVTMVSSPFPILLGIKFCVACASFKDS